MKRLLAAILAVCYLCVSTGFTLHSHYCMGQHVSTSLVKKGDAHKCAKCGMDKKSSSKGCCKDEYKIIKAESDQLLSAKTVLPAHSWADAVISTGSDLSLPNGIPVAYHGRAVLSATGPPGLPDDSCPRFLRLRNIRI